jgi:hypothetical protein
MIFVVFVQFPAFHFFNKTDPLNCKDTIPIPRTLPGISCPHHSPVLCPVSLCTMDRMTWVKTIILVLARKYSGLRETWLSLAFSTLPGVLVFRLLIHCLLYIPNLIH